MTVAEQVLAAASGDGPYIPGPSTFELPGVFGVAGLEITKPMLLFALSVPLIVGTLWLMARRAAVVPGRLQFAGELAYGFVRNIGRDNIGSHDFRRFMPLLAAVFFVVVVNNYWGLVPVAQFPTFSRIGFAVAVAAVVWVVYNAVGIGKHGLFGYLKLQTVPGGVKGPVLLLLVPLEFFSNILVRPVTLALRVFATMFAGHLLLVLFSMGAAYLALELGGLYILAAAGSAALFVMVGFLELLVMFLQAYVFTLLTAIYIGGALADEH